MSNNSKLPRWQYRIVADGTLETGAGLDVVALQDAAGLPVGTLIGFPIDLAARQRLTQGTHRVDVSLGCDVDAFADTVFETLAGRFLWLFKTDEIARIYLDASGQVPCVFDPIQGVAGSSAHVLLDEDGYEARFDAVLHARLGVDGLGWIPGGLTAHDGVQRLLPNHFLDLSDFAVRRHWPMAPVGQGVPEVEVAALIGTVQAQMTALVAGNHKIAQALTAGRETRMLLACARPLIGDIDFVTMDAGRGHVDNVLAGQIARAEGLTHMILPLRMASDAQRRDYLRRNGDCIADANARSFPSVAPLAQSHVFVGGAGGEVGRGFFWRPGDTAQTSLDGAALMGRFGLPAEPRVIAALDAWIAGLEGRSTFDILDLAYLEHRMGPWGGAQFPSDPTLVRFAPLITRPGVRAMMRLPQDWKRGEGMSDAVIKAGWPELMRFAFNTLGPLRDGLAKLRKALCDPGIILRKLRKRFG